MAAAAAASTPLLRLFHHHNHRPHQSLKSTPSPTRTLPLERRLFHHHNHRLHQSLKPTPSPTLTLALTCHRTAAATAAAPFNLAATISMSSSGPATIPAADRLISAAAYTLPFFNGLPYGGHLLAAQPPLRAALLEPILPLLGVYRSMPYASFVAFFALYLGVVRNPRVSRYARFNAMQALVLDVLLALPALLTRILSPGRTGPLARAFAWAHSALFIMVTGCFLYGVVSSVLGRTPYLPFVADAAGRQLG